MVGGQDAGFGRDGNVFSNGEAATVVEPALLVDGAVSSNAETAARIEVRTAENAAALTDFEPHNVAIKREAHRVTRDVRNQTVTNEKESIEPDPAKKRRRSHLGCATDDSELATATLPVGAGAIAFQNLAR